MSEIDPIEALEKRRAERKAETEKRRRAQYAIDLAALADAEDKYGESGVCAYKIDYVDGMPTMVMARCPTPPEAKRFSSKIKVNVHGDLPDMRPAQEELARACLVYPALDVFESLCAARPNVCAQLGILASNLASGKAADEGKD